MGIDKAKIIKDTLFTSAVSIIARGLAVPKSIVVGLVLLPADFGLYNSIFLWFSYLNIMSAFNNGLFAAASRESAHHFGQKGDMATGIEVQNKAISFGSLIPLGILAIYLIYSFQKETPFLVTSYILVGVIFLLTHINSCYERFNSARNLFIGIAKANLIKSVLGSVLVIFTIYYLNIYALFLCPIIGLTVCLIYYMSKMPLKFCFNLNSAGMGKLMYSGLFFGASVIMWDLYFVIDRTFIKLFLNNSIMGLYSFSLMSVMMVQSFLASFQGIFVNTLNKNTDVKDKDTINKVLHYNLYLLYFVFLMVVIIQFFYYVIVEYFVVNYRASGQIFIILSVMIYFYAMFVMPSAVMASKLMRKEGYVAFVVLLGIVSGVIFNSLFVYFGWKGEGIALGTVLSQAIISGVIMLVILRSAHRFDFRYLAKIIILSLLIVAYSSLFYYMVATKYPIGIIAIYSIMTVGAMLVFSQFFFNPKPFQLLLDLYRNRF